MGFGFGFHASTAHDRARFAGRGRSPKRQLKAMRVSLLAFCYPGHRHGRTSLRSQPNSETMALIAARIRGMSAESSFLATTAWLRPRPNKMEEHRPDRQEANAPPNHSQQPADDKLRTEWAGFHALIREIHRSEQDHQAAQRKLGAAQLRIAKGLNRITAIGAIVGAITSIGIIGSLVIAKIAADDAHMALVATNRAWIRPVSATLGTIPSAPPAEGITVPVPFRNTGREPATDAAIISSTDSISIDATYDEIHAKERDFEDYCFSIPGVMHGSAVSIVIFPGGDAVNDYETSITISPDLIDWNVVYGKKYVFLHACVVYQTFGEVRHTSVCYYAQAGKIIGSLPFCDQGNKAD
jgi:hypothetical protein